MPQKTQPQFPPMHRRRCSTTVTLDRNRLLSIREISCICGHRKSVLAAGSSRERLNASAHLLSVSGQSQSGCPKHPMPYSPEGAGSSLVRGGPSVRRFSKESGPKTAHPDQDLASRWIQQTMRTPHLMLRRRCFAGQSVQATGAAFASDGGCGFQRFATTGHLPFPVLPHGARWHRAILEITP
jgi:hypothetical protein